MKRYILLTAIYLAAATGLSLRAERLNPNLEQKTQDTILIKLPDGAGLQIFVKNTAQLKSFKEYKLDSLMALLSTYVEKAEAMEKANRHGDAKEMTLTFHPAKDLKDANAPEQITITFSASTVNKIHENAKESKFLEAIKVFVEIQEKNKSKTDTTQESETKNENKRHSDRWNYKTEFLLGLNSFAKTPSSESLYDLRPLGSRYVSFYQYLETRIGGRNSVFYLVPGLELAFNNFMFDNNNYLVNDNGVSRIVKETARSYEKSKLATSSLNASLAPALKFKDRRGKESFKISAGGFAGYRLGAHTKLKYTEEGKTIKDKDRNNFNLEDFQYGVNFSIGFRKLELFGRYNLNELFKEDRGPEINVVSFGFRI